MKIGAITILITMLTGLLAWGGTQIVDHKERLGKVEALEYRTHEMIKEIRSDIKELLKRRR